MIFIYLAYVELHRTPLLRILLPFILGILFNYYLSIPFTVIVFGIIIPFLFLGYFVVAKNKIQSALSLSAWASIPIYTLLFFAGCFANFSNNHLNNKNHLTYKNNYSSLIVRVLSPPEEKEKTYKVTVAAAFVLKNDTLQATEGKINLYLSKHRFDSTIAYGDYLYIKNKLQKPLTAIGKDSFNYAKYLSHQNIYYQAFLNQNEYTKQKYNQANPFFAFAHHTRAYFDATLFTHLKDSNTYGVASAILLGLRNNIADEINNAYAHAGTVHILAVSGLHVGIIYFALVFLLWLLPNQKWIKLFQTVVLLTFLWLYAMVTGFSPSVVRATIMFSFIAVGKALGRKTNLFNTLAAAALFTLAIDANALFQVGFQLSYLAVAGIGLFYQPLVLLLTPKNKLLTKIWQLLCVSFSAQIATAPLAIYYFHQFPSYFLISNILVVPLAVASVYIGLLLLLTSFLPLIPFLLGKGLHIVLFSTNFIAKTTEQLPYSYVSGLYISIWGILLIYSCLTAIYLFFKTNKATYLIYFLAALIILILLL
jgi:competence protein ComEC